MQLSTSVEPVLGGWKRGVTNIAYLPLFKTLNLTLGRSEIGPNFLYQPTILEI